MKRAVNNEVVAYTLVTVGLIILLINLDILSLNIFSSIAKFWPLIPIGAGLWMLLKRRS